ncbi:hypothetical protein IHE45_01G018300 [Dioscorea alata]|uniref:Uncharacterized protein n=1 Tax=Dioscorea alata TaxID=55571 RepID=A0ACB7WT71_DIOAL|nr:hypothetical protein IHE45_01G018300 [Dioscorea alata]
MLFSSKLWGNLAADGHKLCATSCISEITRINSIDVSSFPEDHTCLSLF